MVVIIRRRIGTKYGNFLQYPYKVPIHIAHEDNVFVQSK